MQTVQFKEKRKDENLKHKSKRKAALKKINAEADFPAHFNDDSEHEPLHATAPPPLSSHSLLSYPLSLPSPSSLSPSPFHVGFTGNPLTIDDLISEVEAVFFNVANHGFECNFQTVMASLRANLNVHQEHGCKLSVIFKRDSVDCTIDTLLL
jgi:hypothetical protein